MVTLEEDNKTQLIYIFSDFYKALWKQFSISSQTEPSTHKFYYMHANEILRVLLQVSVDLSESGDPEHPYAPSSPVSGDRSIELFQGKAPFSRSSSENREGVPLPKTDREIQAWSGHVPTHLFRATHAQQDS